MNHVLVCCCLAAGMLGPAVAGEVENDKTLSPYFMVKSTDPNVDRLPLLSTSAEVDVAGVIADVRVAQVYKNEGKKPIEAIYIFPASTRAAVYGMKMTIGERTVVAEIQEHEQARQNYEDARDAGHSASLLEQQRPNVFQMNVANIMPGDTVRVELSYTELLVPTEAVYEFVYPTVVGPRYSNVPKQGAPDTERWVENPYTHQGDAALYDFDIRVSLAAGLPIQDITCTSHRVNLGYDGLNSAAVRLDRSERQAGNRDFVLKYRLAGGKIETGLLLYQGEEENFFLTMIQPPKRVTPDQIPGREYVFIVDVSGSMYGFPLDISKKLLRDLITNLKPTDRFNVLLFAGGNSVMAESSLAANEKNVGRAVKLIDEQQGGGGTELLPALKRALALPRAKGMSRTVVIATDGYVTVEAEAFDLIRNNLGDANMFAFGIGSGVNRHIIEGMARVGMGEPFVITEPEEAPAQAEKFREYIQSPVLTQVRAEFSGFNVYDVEPPSIPDVLAERPIIVFGKWRGQTKGRVTVRGQSGTGKYQQVLEVSRYRPRSGNAGLRYLWARHRIQLLDDYNTLQPDDRRVKEVTELGLDYNLLTQYTSFVAIDSRVRNTDGKTEVVKQPLPLPQGVSDYAVAGHFTGAAKGGGWLGGMSRAVARPSAPVSTSQTMCEACADEELDYSYFDREDESLPEVKVEIGSVVVGKGLSQTTVEQTLERQMAELERLYARELDKASGLKGTVLVKFTVDADGSITSVQLLKNDLNQAVADALTELFEGMTLVNSLLEGEQTNGYVTLKFSAGAGSRSGP